MEQQIGPLIREWRLRRRLSQLELSLEGGISTRHLSFVETGRSTPSRDMLLRLAELLDVPLRERNVLLLAAGFAPNYPERKLDDPALSEMRHAIEVVLTGHEPFPALAIDRHWTLKAANRAVAPLLDGVAPELLAPPLNVARLSLHPNGLAPRIANLGEWRGHLLHRIGKQIEVTADRKLIELIGELSAYPAPQVQTASPASVVVPFQLQTPTGLLTFFTTTMVFGTPVDVTLEELALEFFFPANPATSAAMRKT